MNLLVQSELNRDETVVRLRSLLDSRSVNSIVEGYTLKSTATPFCVFSLDFRGWSGNNWFGINPFQFVSAMTLAVNENSGIEVIISVRRAIGWMVFWWVVGFFCVAGNFSASYLVLLLPVIASVLIWFVFLQRLVPVEIKNAVRA